MKALREPMADLVLISQKSIDKNPKTYIIKVMKKIIKRIINFFRKPFTLTYQKLNGDIETYKLRNFNYYNYFGNKREDWENVGIRAYCYERKGIRSFRYEGIISITNK